MRSIIFPAAASNKFQSYSSAEGSSEEDEEYTANKKYVSKKKRSKPARTVRDFEMPRFSSRNGKALPNYNESAMFSDLSAEDEEFAEEGGWAEDPGSSPFSRVVGMFVLSADTFPSDSYRGERGRD